MFKGYILSFLLIGSILSSDADSDSHDFKYPGDDDDEGNFTWGGQCESGTRQSPIELITKDAQRIRLPDLKFHNYDVKFGSAELVNNGHTVNIHKFEKEMSVSGGALDDTYILDQVHFHWPTEHVIDNRRYSLEMHLVHRKDDFKNISEAQKSKGGILVLAVLFRAGGDDDANPALDKIFKNKMIDNINDNTEMNKNFKIGDDFDMQDLLPAEVDDEYFYYKGSLTTPPCTESIHWIVFNTLQECSLDQLDIFDNIEDSSGAPIEKNNRVLQRTGQRPVFYVIDEEGDSDDNEELNEKNKEIEEEMDEEVNEVVKKKEAEADNDSDEKKDDDEHDDKHDDDDTNSSLRYAPNPIAILLAFILTTIGAVRH